MLVLLYAVQVQQTHIPPTYTHTHTRMSLVHSLSLFFFFLLLLTPVVQWLTFPCLLSCLIHSSQRFHRCSYSHTRKREKKRKGGSEDSRITPFGSRTSEHKAVGLVLLGAKSSRVLISADGLGWIREILRHFCGSVRRLRCSCVQVQMLGGSGLHIERISVNTTGCIQGAITSHYNKLFHSYTHWNTEGGWILLYCNEVIYCNGEHLQSAVAWISLLFRCISFGSLLTLCGFSHLTGFTWWADTHFLMRVA